MAYVSIDSLNHDVPLAQALGHMVVAWSSAERALQFVMVQVLGIHISMASTAYYRIPTFESRVKFLRAILSEWKTKQYDPVSISTAIDKLSKLAQTRNHWIHCSWIKTFPRGEVTMIVDHREETTSPKRLKPVKAADIMNHVQAVQRRTLAILNLVPAPPLRL
jgi:hypothetical protein